ncbi:DUF1028 domain-containing protein [Methylobacterium persicinum]|uniref:Ntn-hydrolase superfamily protein n=1 Tax=Methylobacterium persicinum TaxID=374426 RepID=A0ABU0HK49_9HYPH|nr:DUF1028 domain-containing protein [Methylobacterium persicinum]MDQ0442681.1 putative Ntn-hydrolase superfamily protein [Methylobacterium persicinum]GJE37072.1 hypothetical protein KHHGKMAE_1128 [Methylobacterium persicinum]
MELNTFSIAARCPRTGQLGVAVASAVPAVGALCPYLRAGVGAVTTQSWVNPYLALRILDGLAGGAGAEAALAAALATDDRADLRQIGLVDAAGAGAAWTGEGCTAEAKHRTGAGYAVQGNMLVSPEVIDAMARAFENSAACALDERLMRALEAGDGAGGDRRGKQSAALRIVEREDYPCLDLRVDDHATPIAQLRRILAVARAQLVPFVAGMPRKDGPAGALPDEVAAMLLKPPGERPGAPSDRAAYLQAQFAPVLKEIETLRDLDLAQVHPPIVFDPSLPYRQVSHD